jgi:hypothetical protein
MVADHKGGEHQSGIRPIFTAPIFHNLAESLTRVDAAGGEPEDQTMAEMPDMSSREVSEQWLAFELLMAWAEAIVRLRPRLETALSRLTRPSRATSTDELRVEVHERRFASHTFNTERHLFIDAAWQLIEYREWVGRLGIVSNDAFRELDPFEKAVKTLKDHAIEYLKGGGDHPDRWIYQAEGGISDASATRLGERLDYIAFARWRSGFARQSTRLIPTTPNGWNEFFAWPVLGELPARTAHSEYCRDGVRGGPTSAYLCHPGIIPAARRRGDPRASEGASWNCGLPLG